MKTILRLITILLIIISLAPAQDKERYKTVVPSGLFVGYGVGSYSVKDEYISKQKYSGTLPCFNVEWVRFHNKKGYSLEFEYRNSGNISNNNISAKVGQFIFNQDFTYSIGNFYIFQKTFMLIWGLL